MQIYFAGPLFTPYERGYIAECAARIRDAGIDVWVPHEHTVEMLVDGKLTAKSVFEKDFPALQSANAVVALLDGPMVDDGTACEIGMFYAFTRRSNQERHPRVWPRTHGLRGPGRTMRARGSTCICWERSRKWGRCTTPSRTSLPSCWSGRGIWGSDGRPAGGQSRRGCRAAPVSPRQARFLLTRTAV